MVDLLVIGEINPDLILRGADVVPEFGQVEKLVEHARLTIGSSSVITACGAARLGLSVAFIGMVGDDDFGRFMLRAMQERGIDTSGCIVDPAAVTGLGVILSSPQDRAILTFPGAIPLLRREQIDDSWLFRVRHLHVGGYYLLDDLRPDLPGLFAKAQGLGLTTSLDTNWDPSEEWDVAATLPHVDLLLPNEQELLALSGKEEFGTAVEYMAARVPTLGVKRGPVGGIARQGQEEASAGVLPVTVVDTTGAGDSFNAGFLFGYLNSYTLQDSLALACACGSLSTTAPGGTTAQPTLQEAQEALRQAARAVD